MRTSVHEAKTNLSKLLAKVKGGERVVITRYGVPAAELVPVRRASVNLGSLRNVVSPPPDEFFEPLDEDGLRIWEGE